jgi:hypothetical protein
MRFCSRLEFTNQLLIIQTTFFPLACSTITPYLVQSVHEKYPLYMLSNFQIEISKNCQVEVLEIYSYDIYQI